MDVNHLLRMLITLAILGAVVYYGGHLLGRVSSKVPG